MTKLHVPIRTAGRAMALVAVVAASLLLVAPATPADAESPSKLCGPGDIYVRVTEWRGQQIVRPLPIASHGGCASSWATGEMSISAVAGQCKRLEEGTYRPDGTFFQLTYPHVFYDIWPAKNRADCIKVLHGLATGTLDADVLPFPF